jgi:hypothetical protein
VNHGSGDNDDFEVDAGNYASGEGRPPSKPLAHGQSAGTNRFLASTEEETTIPSTVSASDPSVSVFAHAYGFTLFDKLYLRNVDSITAYEREDFVEE